jgi:hypothetical protein
VLAVADGWQALWDIVVGVGLLLRWLLYVALAWSLTIAWVAWWLWGVNWVKARAALAQGAWVPVLLLIVLGALAWSQIAPRDLSLGFLSLPNFWWQLGAVGLLAAFTLFLGWLQGVMGWTPEEVPIYPEGGEEGHHGDAHHGHAHAHH